MATGTAAPPLIMANTSHSLLDQESTVSSPLSEIMDGHEMDVDSDSDELSKPQRSRADIPADPASHESDSNLSDIETNDSEAETERLDPTPRKNKNNQSNPTTAGATGDQKSSVDKNLRSFQRSPSKLQEQIRADVEAESESGDADLDDDDEDKGFEARSDAEGARFLTRASQSSRKKTQESHIAASSTAVGSHSSDGSSADSRKRKRTPLPEHSNNGSQTRKRAGTAVEPSDETSPLSKILSEDLEPNNSMGGKSDEEMRDVEDVAESVEKPPEEPTRSKKSRRANTKKRKSSEDIAGEANELDEPTGDAPPAEDEHAEVDDEAQEAAHRNEEELERKRNAFEQLSSIEKQFAVLRDRLYEERLAQLNQEEAQLNCENPTHPEYLAMMQCIDSRRDERLRVNELEYKFNMDALDRWAVSRRSQILSQFYQSIRESREKTLDELGKQWYEIQHERRKNANPIPDFGYRFPKTKTLQKKQAIAHGKETSILAGIAQHHGFPAAPEMKGASHAEVDEDLEAIHRARQSIAGSAQHAQHVQHVQHAQPALNDYGAVPFGRNLGPAGEQFLEQTPWANPRHPSHAGSRRPSHGGYAGAPAFPSQAKASHQHPSQQHQVGGAWFANGQINGDLAHRNSAAPADQESGHARKTNEPPKSKREAIVL